MSRIRAPYTGRRRVALVGAAVVLMATAATATAITPAHAVIYTSGYLSAGGELVTDEDGTVWASVNNYGDEATGAVSLTVTASGLPATLSAPATLTDPDAVSGTCTHAGASVSCVTAGMNPNSYPSMVGIPLVVRATATGTLTLTMTYDYPGRGPEDQGGPVVEQFTVTNPPAASLAATAAASAAAADECSTNPYVGIEVTGKLTVAGGGDLSGEWVEITVVDPADIWEQAGPSLSSTGTFSAVLCVRDTRTVKIGVAHPGTQVARYAYTEVTVVPRASSISLNATPSPARYAKSVRLHGAVTDSLSGARRVGAEGDVTIQSRTPGGSWKDDPGWTTLRSDGTFSAEFHPTAKREYRASYGGDGPGSGPAVSPVIAVSVYGRVAASATPSVLTPGGTSTIRTTVAAGGRRVVKLQRRSGTSWVDVATRTLSGSNTASWTVKQRRKGTTAYRIVWPGTASLLGTTSPAVKVTATLSGRGPATAYKFLDKYRGKPVRWNPCVPITYKVRLKNAPPGALADVKETLRRITQYSGLRFKYKGTTSFVPVAYELPGAPRPAKLLFAWVGPAHMPDFADPGVQGMGGPNTGWTLQGRRPWYKTGSVWLNTRSLKGMKPGFGPGNTTGGLLMHEVGHAVGLNHTNNKYQMMRPVNFPPGDAMFGAGDARGLKLLGRSQGCK